MWKFLVIMEKRNFSGRVEYKFDEKVWVGFRVKVWENLEIMNVF